tara:strand:- start:331 stop:972 length:642 start_codon:yes stop_codon:yes gene_type:complete
MQMLKKALVLVVVLGLLYLGWQNRATINPEMARAWIAQFGILSPAIYILLYAANTVSLLPPIAILSLTAGLAFGPVFGFAYLLTGAMLGTTLTFFIGRNFGREFVQKRLKGKFQSLDEGLGKRGFQTVLFFRVVPVVPYEVLNYASGLSKISFKDYALATLIGVIPGCAVSVFFGDSLTEPLSGKFVAALVALVVLIAIPTVYLKMKNNKEPK